MAKTKAKCGGLSTTAAKAPPPVEMTILFCVFEREHATARAMTEADPCGMTNKRATTKGKSWLGNVVHSHPSG
jgi:hypothetical protein